MENLAFIYNSLDYESPDSVPKVRSFKQLAAGGSKTLGIMGTALVVSVLGTVPQAGANIRLGDRCPAVRDAR